LPRHALRLARHSFRLLLVGALAAGCAASVGCVGLSLGGKTTYVQDPDSVGRMSALEARVTSLEQAMWGVPATDAPSINMSSQMLPPLGTLPTPATLP